MEKLSSRAQKHLLIKKTADYRRLGVEEKEKSRSKSPVSSPQRSFVVRIKHKPHLSNIYSAKSVQPPVSVENKSPPHYSSSDMFELIKQLASDTGVRHYKSFEKKLLKIGTPLSPGDYDNYQPAPVVRNPGSSSPKLRFNHPLLVETEGQNSGVFAPPAMQKKSPWSQHSLFPPPIQPRGSAVTYTIGRKNWLRENDQKIRVAKIKRAFATHR